MSWLYEWLSGIGYHHPLHPPVTHVPVGLVIGAFVFLLASRVLRNESLVRTARHCAVLALLAAPVAVFFGVMDWQHFYGGAWVFPIRVKVVLACALVLFLVLAWKTSPTSGFAPKGATAVYALCLMAAAGLGFFGGELVYGPKLPGAAVDDAMVQQGSVLYVESCAMCHYSDSTQTKIGPGLKNLFQNERLPVSQSPVSAAAVADQLKNPFDRMPAFPDLTDEQVQALVAYLKTL